MGVSLRFFTPHICGCMSSCTPGLWWIAHSTMLTERLQQRLLE